MFIIGNVFPTLLACAVIAFLLIFTIKRTRSPQSSRAQTIALWVALIIATVIMYFGWGQTQNMVESNGVVCGSATNQWLYGVFGSESKFDNPAEQAACSAVGFKSTARGAGLSLLAITIWVITWYMTRPRATTSSN